MAGTPRKRPVRFAHQIVAVVDDDTAEYIEGTVIASEGYTSKAEVIRGFLAVGIALDQLAITTGTAVDDLLKLLRQHARSAPSPDDKRTTIAAGS